jgi:hypothetical protein
MNTKGLLWTAGALLLFSVPFEMVTHPIQAGDGSLYTNLFGVAPDPVTNVLTAVVTVVLGSMAAIKAIRAFKEGIS